MNFIFYSEDFFSWFSFFSNHVRFFPLAHFTLGCNSIINSCCVSFTQLWRSLKNTKNDDSEIEIVSRILRSEILDDFSTSVVNYSQRFRKQWVKVIEKCFSFFPVSWTFQPVTKTRISSKAFFAFVQQMKLDCLIRKFMFFWSVYFCKVVLGSSLIKHLVSN